MATYESYDNSKQKISKIYEKSQRNLSDIIIDFYE